MDEAKPHLEPSLNLVSLSSLLEIHPNHLSQVLNEELNQSFYKFMNSYRIEESKELLLNPLYEHYTIEAIARESGFNSKSTFNKVFRDIMGQTPSEYIKQQKIWLKNSAQ
ncbi:helix-turn-helix domain-containing protein [Chryseobacterium chendengshani]|uniref:helix-turn-helix domain-containing protein n=1 Tax=Chryseobacterium sp. LJ756 TaxID=2864113 RepID=UPI001C643E6C|nr:helix-turn-helix domain-containing protein [Chryseobacterium sp. LJ756]MBW7674181.1 helix-turn-helix domain-containing protein [Chryseobacterium sp. LJ756]